MEISRKQGYLGLSGHQICVLALTGFALWSRLHFTQIAFSHPDEPIAIGVVSGMLKRSTLDTNWAHFNVPSMFHYTQFNFSSFHIFLAAIFKLAGAPTVASIRSVSAVLGALCVPATFELGRRLHGIGAGLFGAALVSISPQLFFSSIFGRADAFFTLLFLCALLPIVANSRSYSRLALSGLIFGLLVACKISALLLLPIPVLFYLLDGGSGVARAALVFSSAMVVGFVIGVPYAVVDPHAFLHGLQTLSLQYGTGGGPAGARDGSFIDRTAYLLKYLAMTAGPLVLIGCAASWRRTKLGIVSIVTAVSIIYLGTQSTFFERNFDHCLPMLFIGGWAGLARFVDARGRRWVLPAIAVIAASSCVYYGFQLQYGILSGRYQERVNAYIGSLPHDSPTWLVWPSIVYGKDPVGAIREYTKDRPLPATITFAYADDHFEEKNIQRFLSEYHYEKLAELRDPFSAVPSNSIQGYLAPSYVSYKIFPEK